MATSSNKPRDIKDLKARLGRTGGATQPGSTGSPLSPPQGNPIAPGSGGLPPPALGGPYTGSPFPGASNPVPAPPFAQPAGSGRASQPQPRSSAPSSAQSTPSGRPVSPFDIMPPAAVVDKRVRIVIDDSAVREDEIGRKSFIRNIVLMVIGVLLGLGMGYAVMSTASERTQFNMAVRDGKAIYGKISEVSKILDTARGSVKAAVEATQGGPGKQAHVDYKAIGDLVALQKPFNAQEFSRRRYLAFPSAVVDDLFEYYNNINLLWTKFGVLGNRTMGPSARDALDKSAQAGDQLVALDYGVVVTKNEGSFIGGLVVVRPKPTDPSDAPAGKDKGKGKDKDKDETPIALVSSRSGSREVERKMFLGQEDFATSPDHYVVVVDKARSMGLLGAGASLFGQLRGDLVETQQLVDKTTELQGRLLRELGKVAALQEQKLLL